MTTRNPDHQGTSGHPKDMLLPYAENWLTPDDEAEVRNHVDNCQECSLEVAELKALSMMLQENKNELCPESWELHTFVNTGKDATGTIEAHLSTCPFCREEAEVMKRLPDSQGMPAETWTRVEALLPTHPFVPTAARTTHDLQPDPKPQSRLSDLWNWFSSLLNVPMLAVATVAAVLVVVLVYPGRTPGPLPEPEKRVEEQKESEKERERLLAEHRRKQEEFNTQTEQKRVAEERNRQRELTRNYADLGGGGIAQRRQMVTKPFIALSSIKWDAGDDDIELMSPTPQMEKPAAGKEPEKKLRATMLIRPEESAHPLTPERIDQLYEALNPSPGLTDRFDFVTPEQIKQAITGGSIKNDSQGNLVRDLGEKLLISKVLLISIMPKEKAFDIKSELIDTATGNILKEKSEQDVLPNQLRMRVREASRLFD